MEKKELKFTIIAKESKKVIAEQLVIFGSKDKPFPNDWNNDPHVQIGIQNHKKTFLNSMFNVEVSEDILESKVDKMFTIDEIKKYILSKDSWGDTLYYLSADNIIKANEQNNEDDEEVIDEN